MSDILIINASPRREGTSAILGKMCADKIGGDICHLYSDINSVEWLLPKISKAETIIFSGPCYINTYPAQFTYLLERIAERPEICKGQKVYGIINGGMPYAHTHESGLRMLKLFCMDCNMQYKGGFVIGLGPVLNGRLLNKHPNSRKMVPAFDKFLQHIGKSEESPDKLYCDAEIRIPSIIMPFLVFMMNKRIDKNLKKYGFNYKNPSPYWK